MSNSYRRIDFDRIASLALPHAETLCWRWLPDGRRQAREWTARNPRRNDRNVGNFKVNLNTGKWGDFATGDFGGDLVSLAAYLFGLDQREAAIRVADMLGVSPYEQ